MGSGAEPSDVIGDLLWYVPEYRKCHSDALDCCRFSGMAVDGSIMCISDRYRVKSDTYVGTRRCHRSVMERDFSGLIIKEILANIPFVGCEEGDGYFCKSHALMSSVLGLKSADGADLSLRLFGKPFSNLHLLHGGRLQARVLELEICQWTLPPHACAVGLHIVEMFEVTTAERAKFHVGVSEACRA